MTKNGAATPDATYLYDNNGNRTSLTTASGTITGVPDAQDRLVSYGQYAYTYTDNGELLTKTDRTSGAVTRYAYDARGNLIQVVTPTATIDYIVDGMNRRVGKKKGGALVQQWLYRDDLRIAAELGPTGALVSRFVYATDRHTPDFVVRVTAGTPKTYRIVSDHLGSPRYVVPVDTSAATPVVNASYDAFGAVDTASTGMGIDGTTPFLPMGFAGGLYDADTGLVRFGARDYDPVTGRWTSKDPIRFEGGQENIYAYVGDDPVNSRDETGNDGVNLYCPIHIISTARTCAQCGAFVALVVDTGGLDEAAQTRRVS